MQITNTQPGPRGINTVNGPVLVEPGQTIEVKVYAREQEHIVASGWFEVDGDFEADPDTGNAGGQVTVTNSDGKDGVYIPSNEFNAMRDAFENQTNELARLQSENEDLRNQIAALQAGSSNNDANPKGPFEVKETAPGWFGIFGANGEQIGKNIREADAEVFKGLSADEQEKYLAP